MSEATFILGGIILIAVAPMLHALPGFLALTCELIREWRSNP